MTPRPDIAAVPDPPAAPSTRGIVLDNAAKVYDLLMPAVTLLHGRGITDRTVQQLTAAPGDRILDIGCATGEVTLAVARKLDARHGGMCVGIDAAPRMIRRARRKIRNLPCRFDIGVAESLPYADAVFDKAVSTFFFHHLNLEDKLAALREIHRVLRPEGALVLADVDIPTTSWGRFCARAGQWLFRQDEIGENIDGRLRELFEPAGFGQVDIARHDLGYVTTFVLSKSLTR